MTGLRNKSPTLIQTMIICCSKTTYTLQSESTWWTNPSGPIVLEECSKLFIFYLPGCTLCRSYLYASRSGFFINNQKLLHNTYETARASTVTRSPLVSSQYTDLNYDYLIKRTSTQLPCRHLIIHFRSLVFRNKNCFSSRGWSDDLASSSKQHA